MGSTSQLSAFGVMGRSLLILLRNFPVFVFLGLLLFTPVFVGSLIVGPGASIHASRVAVDDVVGAPHTELGGKVVIGILTFLAYYLVAGGVSYGVRQTLQGRHVPLVEGVREGLRRLWLGLDAAFVTGLAVGIGFALLVVPGVWLACLTFVAVPVALLEERGVVESLRRSRDLTRGHRLPVFVVFLATLAPMVLAGFFVPDLLSHLGRTLALLIAAHAQVAFALLGGIAQNVVYHDLGPATASGLSGLGSDQLV